MKKIVNLLKENILIVFGLVIGITISNMIINATGGGLSASSVDIDKTNMSNISGTTVESALDYLYEKAYSIDVCPDGYTCLGYTVEWASDKTYLGILYLNPTDLYATCNETLASQNLNNESTPTPTGVKTGCMKWYIYGTDSNNDYLALLDHNTTPLVQWNTNSDTGSNVAFENSVAYSYLTDLTKPTSQGGYGWVVTPRLISGQEIADLANNGSWTATSANYYLGSNSTTSYSSMNATQKAKQQSFAWLFDYTYDCTSNGCSVADPNIYNLANNTSKTNNSYGYWTSTPAGTAGAGSRVWRVGRTGNLLREGTDYVVLGLRPVITISSSLIS